MNDLDHRRTEQFTLMVSTLRAAIIVSTVTLVGWGALISAVLIRGMR